MKENSIKNERSSIEEDMKILEEFKTHGYAMLLIKYEDRNKTNLKIEQAIEHILSDYKRVLKENEELKQDRNNNYQMIALAQNEVLGYMQGYEDGKKLKRSAVACVVENQQYYIIKKEIEHYKEYIEKLQKENEELEEINNELEAEKNEAIRRYNFETISIQKVKDKIEEINKKILNAPKYDEKISVYRYQKQILQELIEESE